MTDFKVSKKRHAGGGWVICVNGKETNFRITKGDELRYREPREYVLFNEEASLYINFRGVELAVAGFSAMAKAILAAAEATNNKR